MIKKNKLPTILGLVILTLGTFFGVFLINFQQIFKLGAQGETAPKDVRVSNITDSTFTISFTTDKESRSFIVWDKGATAPDGPSYTHLTTLTGLKANTTYSYKINSGGTLFDNNGIPWQAKTAAGPQPAQNSSLVSGSVITATGEVVKNAIVYITVSGNLFSTLTSNSGNFVFQLFNLDPQKDLLEIFVQAGGGQVSSAQIFPQSANPVPPMIVGQTHDFRNLPPSTPGQVPSASLDLPSESESKSKFSPPDASTTPQSQAVVTLESIDEGETVTSQEPEFFGDGPGGTTLTITVESENPITDTVNVAKNGSWNWNPPAGLTPGVHKITITWKDITGITRSLTRNFVVQAGEVPAFEASSSGQTATPTPSPTASSSATSKPTSTPKVSASPTSVPVPQTGNLTPTLLLTIMGAGILLMSLITFKYAQNL